MRPGTHVTRFFLTLAAAAASGCTDLESPTASVTPAAPSRAAQPAGGIIHEPRILRAFEVGVRASGSMQPGKPIQVHVDVRANLPVADAEVVVATPDLDRPRASTWNPRFSPSPGQKVAKRLSRRSALARGGAMREAVQLTIPAPGYYRVTVSAVAHSPLPVFVDDTLRVVSNIHREIWLRVDRRGGHYTARFDTLAFPRGAERRPGPLHCVAELKEERAGKKRDPGCDGALITAYDVEGTSPATTMDVGGDFEVCPMNAITCGTDPCEYDPASCEPYTPPPPTPTVDPCYAGTHLCIEFVYLDRSYGYNIWRTAPEGTLVEGSYQDEDCFGGCWWNEEHSVFVRADHRGRVILRCPSSSTEKRLRTAYEFLDEYTAVSRSEWDGPTVRGACPTGVKRVEMAPNQEAYVYGNVRKSAQRAASLFGRSSDRVRVDFDSHSLAIGSWYDAPLHIVSIKSDDIWDDEGASTQAHEYGHSYHHRALGGIGHIYLSSADPSHYFESNSNGAKALLEGFAAFFETLVMPNKGENDTFVRSPGLWTGGLPVGPRAESRVAAFLWDVVDDDAEKGSRFEYLPFGDPQYTGTNTRSIPQEPYDPVQISHYDLGRVLRDCRTGYGLLTVRPESIDGIRDCLGVEFLGLQYAIHRLYERTVWDIG